MAVSSGTPSPTAPDWKHVKQAILPVGCGSRNVTVAPGTGRRQAWPSPISSAVPATAGWRAAGRRPYAGRAARPAFARSRTPSLPEVSESVQRRSAASVFILLMIWVGIAGWFTVMDLAAYIEPVSSDGQDAPHALRLPPAVAARLWRWPEGARTKEKPKCKCVASSKPPKDGHEDRYFQRPDASGACRKAARPGSVFPHHLY